MSCLLEQSVVSNISTDRVFAVVSFDYLEPNVYLVRCFYYADGAGDDIFANQEEAC